MAVEEDTALPQRRWKPAHELLRAFGASDGLVLPPGHSAWNPGPSDADEPKERIVGRHRLAAGSLRARVGRRQDGHVLAPYLEYEGSMPRSSLLGESDEIRIIRDVDGYAFSCHPA